MEISAYIYKFDKEKKEYVLDEKSNVNGLTLEELMNLNESSPMTIILALPRNLRPQRKVINESLAKAYRTIFEHMPLVRAPH